MSPDAALALERHVSWLGHAGFLIEVAKRVVYVDPYRIGGGWPEADVVLITHDHFDHFSPEDLTTISKRGTVVVAPPTVAEQLSGSVISLAPGESAELDPLDVAAVAAYNTNKLDSDGRPFHDRDAGWLGYLVTIGGLRVYHSGDTDVIPEMDEAAGADIALLPVSGTYVMTASEACEAARRIAPKLAVPMHWGTLVGSRADAEQFERDAPVDVRILDRRVSEV